MGFDDECGIIAGGGFNGNEFTAPSPLNESSFFLSVEGEMMIFLTSDKKMCTKNFVPTN